jgi:hypothetical protein
MCVSSIFLIACFNIDSIESVLVVYADPLETTVLVRGATERAGHYEFDPQLYLAQLKMNLGQTPIKELSAWTHSCSDCKGGAQTNPGWKSRRTIDQRLSRRTKSAWLVFW